MYRTNCTLSNHIPPLYRTSSLSLQQRHNDTLSFLLELFLSLLLHSCWSLLSIFQRLPASFTCPSVSHLLQHTQSHSALRRHLKAPISHFLSVHSPSPFSCSLRVDHGSPSRDPSSYARERAEWQRARQESENGAIRGSGQVREEQRYAQHILDCTASHTPPPPPPSSYRLSPSIRPSRFALVSSLCDTVSCCAVLLPEAASQFEEERKAWKERRAAKLASGGDTADDQDAEERMIQKGRNLQQQNRESLANSIRMAKEATDVGQETLMKMTAQREQMKKMDDDLDKTNESLNRSERVIRGMKSTIGGLKNLFSKPTAHHSERLDLKDVRKEVDREEVKAAKEHHGTDEPEQHERGTRGHSDNDDEEDGETDDGQRKLPVGQRDLSNETAKSGGAIQEFRDNQKVEDEQLDELGDLLGQLKGQAKDMNKELRIQEKVVDHLGGQVDKTGARVKSADSNVKLIR